MYTMGDTRSTLDTSRTSFYEYRPLPASHVEEGSSSSLSNAEGVAPTSSTTVNMDSATEPSIENNSNEVGWAFSQLHRPGRLERLDTYVRGSSYLIARIPNDEVNQTTPTFRNGRCMVEYQPYPPSVSHRLFSDALETTKQSVNEIRAVDLRALDGALDTRPVDSSESNGTSPTSRYKPGGVLTMILEDLGDETKNNLNTKGKGKVSDGDSS